MYKTLIFSSFLKLLLSKILIVITIGVVDGQNNLLNSSQNLNLEKHEIISEMGNYATLIDSMYSSGMNKYIVLTANIYQPSDTFEYCINMSYIVNSYELPLPMQFLFYSDYFKLPIMLNFGDSTQFTDIFTELEYEKLNFDSRIIIAQRLFPEVMGDWSYSPHIFSICINKKYLKTVLYMEDETHTQITDLK